MGACHHLHLGTQLVIINMSELANAKGPATAPVSHRGHDIDQPIPGMSRRRAVSMKKFWMMQNNVRARTWTCLDVLCHQPPSRSSSQTVHTSTHIVSLATASVKVEL